MKRQVNENFSDTLEQKMTEKSSLLENGSSPAGFYNAGTQQNPVFLLKSNVKPHFGYKTTDLPNSNTKKSKPWYVNLDYISTVFGLLWYGVIIATSYFEIKTARITEWCEQKSLITSVTYQNGIMFGTMIFGTAVITTIVNKIVDKKLGLVYYLLAMFFVFISQLIGSQCYLRSNGFGAAIWCIVFGALARLCCNEKRFDHIDGRIVGLDFFIKVGIVLLAVDLNTIGVSGAKGLVVAWVETILLLIFTYWVAKCVLKDDNHAILVSAGLSICGSSAIIALCSIVGVGEKSDFTVALLAVMTILTVPLIPALPKLGQMFLNGSTVGSWIGGCVDSTGAVVASSSLGNSSDTISTALVVKMAQNILIGPVAMVVTQIWSKECKFSVLWDKFPKFVLGFILVAVVTFCLPDWLRTRVTDDSFAVSEWWSNISFVLLGFEINLRKAKSQFGEFANVAGVYVFGQLVDIGSTLLVSWLMFTVLK